MTSTNTVVANAMAARNADADANKDDIVKWEIDRISARITSELKKQAEDYAYWMEKCGRSVDALMSYAVKLESNGRLSPSIIAEIKKLRKRLDDALAASKRLPR